MNNSKLKKITHARLFLPIVCLIAVLLINVIKTPDFFNITIRNGVLYGYVIDVINRASELVILAVGMTLVTAASGGQDISVGAVMAVAAAVCCQILSGGASSVTAYQNSIILAVVAALLASALCGAFNGLLVAKLNIQPMVATLILYTAGRGIAQLVTNGQITYIRVPSFQMAGGYIGKSPVPTPVLFAIITVVIVALILKKTALGLYIESVGINGKAARLVGLNSTNILFICGGAFDGLEKIVEARLDRKAIGFNTELGRREDKDISELLQEVTPHDLVKFGLIPEFVGRVPICVSLRGLDREALIRILQEPKNALVKQYQKLFQMDNVELSFEQDAIEAIADKALERKTGARGLRSIMESVMMDTMYEIPSDDTIEECVVTKAAVDGESEPLTIHDESLKKAK